MNLYKMARNIAGILAASSLFIQSLSFSSRPSLGKVKFVSYSCAHVNMPHKPLLEL